MVKKVKAAPKIKICIVLTQQEYDKYLKMRSLEGITQTDIFRAGLDSWTE